jgi:hypothetical protein
MWQTHLDYQKALKDLQTASKQAELQVRAYLSLLKTYSTMDWMLPKNKPTKE